MAEQKVKLTDLPEATDTIDNAQLLINQNSTDQKLAVTHFLRAKNNLSDLINTPQARANLGVPSVDEVDARLTGFIDGSYNFTSGGSLASRNDFIWDEESKGWYYWSGSLPKDVPASSTPESTGGVKDGAWKRVGATDAAINADDVSVSPQGNLSQLLIYVTPEQFGAIGDGTIHPLSERYATLAAAQAVYPHVTALSQTIDWAACQAAENYARGRCVVEAPYYANYHFKYDYLTLGINSKWESGRKPQLDAVSATIRRSVNPDRPTFGQDCFVRVMDAATAGSPDEFIRGVVFIGFRLTYDLPRRSPTKSTGRIGVHLNYAIKSEIDVTVHDCEYGVFGYSCWGATGTIRIDSCHKGFYADPRTPTPENPTPSNNTVTSFDLRIEIDACPFGIVLRDCFYSKFTGWIEGAVVGQTNYDSANETACAVTILGGDGVQMNIGVEAWEGIHALSSNAVLELSETFAQQKNIVSTTGKNGPWHAMSILTGNAQPLTIPSGDHALFYSTANGRLTIKNLQMDASTPEYNSAYISYQDTTSRVLFFNTRIYTGSVRRVSPTNWANVDVINDRYLEFCFLPGSGANYKYIGKGVCKALTYSNASISSDGSVVVTPPAGWQILGCEAYVITSTAAQAQTGAMTVKTLADDGSSITFQTAKDASYGIKYRLELLISK